MAANISSQQIKDINSTPAYLIACDRSRDVQVLRRYVNFDGPQEEILDLVQLKGQTRGEDICEAVLNCLNTKEITRSVSGYWWSAFNERSTEGLCDLTPKETGLKAAGVSLHPAPRGTVHLNISPECMEVMILVILIVN